MSVRRGFSWVGLLVVLLVVAVFAGLLLSSVCRVREASARVRCVNNLKQLGLAVENYRAVYGHYPPGTAPNTTLTPDRRLGVHVLLLPYIEAQPVDSRLALAEPWDSDRNAGALGGYNPGALRCPSSEAGSTPGRLMSANYVGVAGVGADAATLPPDDPRAGVIGYDRTMTAEQLKDGLSNTALFVETGWELGPWARGGPSTVRGVDPGDQPITGPGRPFGGLHRRDTYFPWQEKHTGSNVGLADGSVRYLRDAADPAVVLALATVAGGEAGLPGW